MIEEGIGEEQSERERVTNREREKITIEVYKVQ